MVILSDASAMLSHISISQNVRQVLEGFVLSLTLIIGDEKAAPEAHMMHNIQLALGKSDVIGSSSNTDTVSFSLVLNYLVTYMLNTLLPHLLDPPGVSKGQRVRLREWYRPWGVTCKPVQVDFVGPSRVLHAATSVCVHLSV
jgi:hypothetical protein